MLRVCIGVIYVCNFTCYVQRVELKLLIVLGNCTLEKLSIIIIIIIIIILFSRLDFCHVQFSQQPEQEGLPGNAS